MSLSTNSNFTLLVEHLQAQGAAVQQRTEDSQEYRDFLAAYPLEHLNQLTMDEYCVGKGDGASFCWWIERGLVPVLGRYMPGTAKGHILYFQADGSLYKNRRLADLSDEQALRYTLAIQSTIAAADPADMLWVDDDKAIYQRAGVEARVTVGEGRKLRLLSCYHPSATLPISSSEHLAHYLQALGCPAQDIPRTKQPVARMLKLREYYQLACESVPGLSPYGFMRGLYSDEMGLAPVKKDVSDDLPIDGEYDVPTYLLTWNPDNFKLGGDKGVSLGDEISWSCHSKKPQPGDYVYLIRLGQEPRGIVAKGVVTEGSHEAPDWRDASKVRNYIRFRVVEHRPDCASGLLPMLLLKKALGQQQWSAQSSGIEIAPAVLPELERLWAAGADTHSLRQYVDWSRQDAGEASGSWITDYQAITTWAHELVQTPGELTEEALSRLWREVANGVSSLGQGALPKGELSRNIELLRDMTRQIMSAPNSDTYLQIKSRWRVAVNEQLFSTQRPAAIRRVFAAFAPVAYTSVLNTGDCQFLLSGLRDQFQLPYNAENGWCELNRQIKTCMATAGLESERVLENNIAIWQLLVALRGTKAAEDELLIDEESSMDGLKNGAYSNVALNQILFGPPGTGKTHNTINEALRILDPELVSKPGVQRDELTAAFKRYVNNGQVVFCTFHQSFSYEDFVEGLRAGCDDEGQLEYRVEPGVLKRLCADAERGASAKNDPFERAFERLKERLESTGERIVAQTVRNRRFAFEYVGGETFRVFPEESQEQKFPYRAALSDIRRLYRTGDKSSMHNASYVQGILQYLRDECELPEFVAELPADFERQKYVLIIDEINRGNVSRIFGELITLIEESKRAGRKEHLEVTLPYSKERFGVPDNVYLIGTMNTADRSLAGLDIALRRRFTFKEMPPRPELLDGVVVANEIDMGELLRVMNQRIEVLLDRDHCLGHAYFLDMKDTLALRTLENLAGIFKQKILPLLQEYFFEDWERIGWVLNDQNANTNDSEPFVRTPASQQGLAALFGNEVANKLNDRRWELNEAAFNSIASYRNILGGAV